MALNLQKVLDGKTDLKGWAKKVGLGGGAVVIAQLSSAYACTRWNEHRVLQRICGSSCANVGLIASGAAAKHYLPRPHLMGQIRRLLQPGHALPSDAFYCIMGSPNSGKTHSVRLACESIGSGVIYVQVNVPDMFGHELAAAIDFQGSALNVINFVQNNFVKAIFASDTRSSPTADDTDRAIEALVKGATSYQKRHKRPVVLVVDDVDRLAEKQPGLLEELQGHAKAWSNAGLVRVVFVLSDGPALSHMKRRSAWSRANVTGFVTVGDIEEGSARKYLAGRGLQEADAEAVVKVAGGRIGLLSHLATSIADLRISKDDALHSLVDAAADEFKVAGMLDRGSRRDGGLAAAKALLDAGAAEDDWRGISVLDWSRLVPDPADQKALLTSRVFVRHYPRQQIMFGSRPTALYAQRLLQQTTQLPSDSGSGSSGGSGGSSSNGYGGEDGASSDGSGSRGSNATNGALRHDSDSKVESCGVSRGGCGSGGGGSGSSGSGSRDWRNGVYVS